jgi:hypothetical protein
VRTGRKPIATPEHALHVLEIMLKAQQSAREGRSLVLESSFDPPQFNEAGGQEAAHLMHDRSREHSGQNAPV